jgi:hypothetical protein
MAIGVAGFFPGDREWWDAHAHTAPSVILLCGIDGCRAVVGEIKINGDFPIALMHSRFGERTVPYTPRVTEEGLGFAPGTILRDADGETLSQRQDRRLAELDAETIKYVEDGQRLAKRYNAGSTAMPLDYIGHIICPGTQNHRAHGIVDLPDPDAAVAQLRAFIADTAVGTKRKYLMFRG